MNKIDSYQSIARKTTIKIFKKFKQYNWKYRNLIFLFVSFVIAYFILTSNSIISLVQNLGYFGYPASFIAGMFFTYGLTTIPATAAIYNLGQSLNPFLIAFIGAFGSVVSDYLIFKFVRDRLLDEIKLLSKEINNLRKPISSLFLEEQIIVKTWKRVSRSKAWQLIIPVIAGFIIASPLPDELGAALFGAIKFNPRKFLLAAYFLNFIGILLIALSTRIFG